MEIFIIFVFWVIFWSFGSVLISRLDDNFSMKKLKGIMIWRSQCPQCKKTLERYNLIPIFSYIFQKWKCANCKQKISFFYPALELCSGIIFVISFLVASSLSFWSQFSSILSVILFIFINWSLLLLIFYDILKYELNIYIFYFLALISLVYLNIWNNFDFLIWSLVLWVLFLLIYFFSIWYVRKRWFKDFQEWFGLGDVILAFCLGLFIHLILSAHWFEYSIFNIVKFCFSLLLLSSIVWLLYFLVERICFGKKEIMIPFLPAMIISFWLLWFFYSWFWEII